MEIYALKKLRLGVFRVSSLTERVYLAILSLDLRAYLPKGFKA